MMHLCTKTTYCVHCDGCGRHAGPAADTMTVALLQGHELEWVSITSDAGDVRHLCLVCQRDHSAVEECLRAPETTRAIVEAYRGLSNHRG